MMKRIISISLVIMLFAGILAGCGNKQASNYEDDANKDVTLVVAIPWAEQKDAETVVEEVNKRLEKLLPHTKIELLLDASMADKWSLWMSTQKTIDIAHSGLATTLEDEVRQESYIALDSLVADYAPNIQELQKTYWNAYDNATIDGKLYAIPNVQVYAKTGNYIKIWKEAAAYMDLQALKDEAWSSEKTTEKFWAIVSEGLDKAAAAGVNCSESVNLSLYEIAKRGYVFIGGDISNICYEKSGDSTILDFYTTEEFKTFCSYMKKWAEKGYVSKDILTGQWSDKLQGADGYSYGINEKTGIKEQNASDSVVEIYLDNPENAILTTNVGEQKTYWSIPYSSENPVRAMKFLDLLHSEEGAEIANLLAYGVEGTHYEFTNEGYGEIKAFEYQGQGSANTSYGIPCWMISNMLQGLYTVSPYTHELRDWAKEYYTGLNDVKKHELYGYSFDITVVRNELSQVLKNNAEYAESIYSGLATDSEGMLKTLQDRNKAVGFDKIMEELQKQADEYIKSK